MYCSGFVATIVSSRRLDWAQGSLFIFSFSRVICVRTLVRQRAYLDGRDEIGYCCWPSMMTSTAAATRAQSRS